MAGARKQVVLEEPLWMRHGAQLAGATVAYETWGALAPARDNALLILTGLSPSAHARSCPEDPTPGWWEGMIGPGHAIDTNKFHVVCVNSLGSCFGSTGPASIDPATGARYGLRFPVLTLEDVATAAHEALRAIGISRLAAVVGPSLGGMSALAYAMLFPDDVGALVTISSAPHATPFAVALRSLQRELIRSDPAWQGGEYPEGGGPAVGMRLARKLGFITYRSAAEWRLRFGRERVELPSPKDGPFGPIFEIESYLEMHARKFTGSFDANCYLYLSRAMDLFDAAEHGGSVAAGLALVAASKVLVVGVESDFLFPLDQQQEIATHLQRAGRDVRFEALASIQGHDSFLVDMERFQPVVGTFLNGL